MPNASGNPDQKFMLCLLIIGISVFLALLIWPELSRLIYHAGIISVNVNISKDYVLDKAEVVVFLAPYSHWDPDWWMPWNQSSERVYGIISKGMSDLSDQDNLTLAADTLAFVRYFYEHSNDDERLTFTGLSRSGRISLAGGMVTQPDTNLVAEPGIIWDIFIGHRWVNGTLGMSPSSVSMQCDPFGHSPSLPIILTQSGYGCLYIGRSGQDQNLPLVFWWISPVDNSTKVLTYNLGYWEGDFLRDALDPSSVKDRLLDLVDALEGRTRSTTLLLLVGTDFVNFSNTLTQLADGWNVEYLNETGVGLVVGTPEEFFDRVASHELDKIPSLAVDINPLWQGFYGTRPQGRASERISEYYLTTFDKLLPILRYLESDLQGKIEKANELRWLASMNHHHDTITGTSPDDTWRSSEWPRFEEVEDGTRALFEGAIETITESAAGNGSYQIVVFNPLSHNRSEVVRALVEVPKTWNSFVVVDRGEKLPTQILSEMDNSGYSTKNVSLAFYARDLPSIGYRTFTLINGTSPPMVKGASISLMGDLVVLDNDVINLTLKLSRGGAIDSLIDRRSGCQVLGEGSGQITYYEDLGGAYSMRVTSVLNRTSEFRVSELEVLQGGPLVAAIRLSVGEGNMSFDETYTIYADSPFVDVSLRVRPLPDTTLTAALRPSFNGSHFINHVPFGVVERPMDENFWPISYWASLEGGGHGVAVFDFGEQGFRTGGGVGDNGNLLEFMLVRDGSEAVGPEGGFTFSDLDFHDLEYRICPYSSDWKSARVWLSAYDYDFPLVARFASHGRSILPRSLSSFNSEGGEIIDLIPLESDPDKFLIITANYNGSMRIGSSMALESVYTSYVDGRTKDRIEYLDGAFEVNDIKSLETYEVVLGKPEFVDAVDDG